MSRNSPYNIVLTKAETLELRQRSCQYTLPYYMVVRAQMILLAAQGLRNDQIAARLNTIQPRIIKGTYHLAKCAEVAADERRLRLYFSEDSRQRSHDFRFAHEIPIVGSVLSRVLPDPFGGIELRRIGRQLVYLQPVAIALKPRPNILVLVVGSVVLNKQCAAASESSGDVIKEA